MQPEIQQLRYKVSNLVFQLRKAEAELDQMLASCPHEWGNPVYDPIVTYDPGDPPGTMGVDWRPGGFVEGTEEKRWSRTCARCGKVEYTSRVTEIVTTKPRF